MDLEITAADFARALGVSTNTVNVWLKNGKLHGKQSYTRRWRVKVSELYRLLDKGGEVGAELEADAHSRLVNDILPKYQTKQKRG